MDLKSAYYPESDFGGFTDVDGTVAFYLRVNSLINASSIVLDIGCGRGAYVEDPVPLRRNLQILNGKVRKVIGIDVSELARDNPFLDELHLVKESSRWPLEDSSVDVGLCDYTLEHIRDPDLFFSECRRVIKPGGYLCIRTTNVLSYVGILSKLIPNKYHSYALNKAQAKRKDEDIFPTVYRCNTVRSIRRMLNKHGFPNNCVYGYDAEPSYLSFSRFFYSLGVVHQRFAPHIVKVYIFAFAQNHK